MNIGFIGAGNMGGALARAISKVSGTKVYIYDKIEEKAMALAKEIGGTFSDFDFIIGTCDFVFLGVKPNGISEVCARIGKQNENKPIIVSMAAGVKIEKIEASLGADFKVIRIMPNTPVAVGEGLTAYSKNTLVSKNDVDNFERIMQYTGTTEAINEDKIDAFCAIAGCGPAYAYMFIDALANGGEKCGLSRERAIIYASKMIRGAALMALESGLDPETLKRNVCSPGGSTIEGVKVLEAKDFPADVSDAIEAAFNRTKELGKQ